MITDQDRAFARAVVALATEHGVKRLSFSFGFEADRMLYDRGVSVSWKATEIGISLRTEVGETIATKEPPAP